MVVTDDVDLAATMRSQRNQGRDQDSAWLRHVQLGYNYRIDEISAALGVAQLRRLEELRVGRQNVFDSYRALLSASPWLRLPQAEPPAEVDWFVYVVQVDRDLDRNRLMADLARLGIPSRPYFSPIHLQPFYMSQFGYRPGDFPRTERVASRTLALPFSSLMTEAQVRLVGEALVEAGGLQFAA